MANLAVIDTSPVGMLTQLSGWETLSRQDQIAIEKITKSLGQNFQTLGRSRLALAEDLTNLYNRVKGKMFGEYLTLYHIKKSTAFKAMNEYKNAVQWLPDPVMREAMRRNMPIMGEKDDKPLGVYTDSVKRLPPPKTEDPVKINAYLDSIEESRKRARARVSKKVAEIETDPDTMTMEVYRFACLRMSRLPARGKRRFMDHLVGVLLTEIGLSGKQTFEAEAIPDGFRAQVGRPRNQEEAV